ncbi:MAG: hypothetical protein IPJ18_19460 [Betaproteobacteria bacterium]|nr:hypothetical protein [Betaproteobacteria bacterium]
MYAKEVEDALLTHPSVSEVAVLGLPDPQWGEAVAAFVVLRAGLHGDIAALQRHCGELIAGYKSPAPGIYQRPATQPGRQSRQGTSRPCGTFVAANVPVKSVTRE